MGSDHLGPLPNYVPKVDMVNHPPHYRGPEIQIPVQGYGKIDLISHRLDCIQVIRHITDMRLANAMKYIWRVAFGGKGNDREDIQKAIWYLNDWLENPISQDQDAHLNFHMRGTGKLVVNKVEGNTENE